MELRQRRNAGRKRSAEGPGCSPEAFLDCLSACKKIVVFTGSGLSASSGMSMFSTRNGLYDRARKKFKIQDGIKLFTYSFYKQRRAEVQAFFAQIYSEAQGSQAAQGHHALAALAQAGRLHRHYTLNIDGLAEVVGLSTWHHEHSPNGLTVEMHGNIRQLVCPSCHAVEPLSRPHICTMRSQQAVPCKACGQDTLRFKIMLYDDDQGDCITPEHVFETLEEDLEVADAVLWVGISFEQSASVEYFRRVRSMLSSLGRLEQCMQAIINPSDDAYFNIISSMCNVDEIKIMDVRGQADVLLPQLAERIQVDQQGIPPLSRTPTPALTSNPAVTNAASNGSGGMVANKIGAAIGSGSMLRRVRGGMTASMSEEYVYDGESDYEKDPHEAHAAANGGVGLDGKDGPGTWPNGGVARVSRRFHRRNRSRDGSGSSRNASPSPSSPSEVPAQFLQQPSPLQVSSMKREQVAGQPGGLMQDILGQLMGWQQQLQQANTGSSVANTIMLTPPGFLPQQAQQAPLQVNMPLQVPLQPPLQAPQQRQEEQQQGVAGSSDQQGGAVGQIQLKVEPLVLDPGPVLQPQMQQPAWPPTSVPAAPAGLLQQLAMSPTAEQQLQLLKLVQSAALFAGLQQPQPPMMVPGLQLPVAAAGNQTALLGNLLLGQHLQQPPPPQQQVVIGPDQKLLLVTKPAAVSPLQQQQAQQQAEQLLASSLLAASQQQMLLQKLLLLNGSQQQGVASAPRDHPMVLVANQQQQQHAQHAQDMIVAAMQQQQAAKQGGHAQSVPVQQQQGQAVLPQQPQQPTQQHQQLYAMQLSDGSYALLGGTQQEQQQQQSTGVSADFVKTPLAPQTQAVELQQQLGENLAVAAVQALQADPTSTVVTTSAIAPLTCVVAPLVPSTMTPPVSTAAQ